MTPTRRTSPPSHRPPGSVARVTPAAAGRALVVVLALLGALLTATTPAAAATWSASLTRYPWLADLGTSRVAVTWAASVSSTGTVTWGPAGGTCTGGQATATKKTITVNGVTEYQYVARMTGLAANTAYCYRVYTGTTTKTDLLGADPSPVFTTLPPAGSTGPVSFAVIGDWGDTTTNGVNPGDTTNGVNPDQAGVIAQIARSGARFAVTTADVGYPSGNDNNYGDLNQTGTDISAVFGPTFWKQAGATVPMFATVGNHGLNKTVLQNWPEEDSAAASGGVYGLVNYPPIDGSTAVSSPSAWYAVQAGNVRVYLLDAAWSNGNVPAGHTMYDMDYQAHWTTTSDEYRWLAADLAAHPGGVKFALFHYPLHSDNATETSDTSLQGQSGVEGLLARYDVAAVFNGHAHLYQRNTPQPGLGRMVSYITGGGGARLEPMGGKGCSATDAYGIGWSYSSGGSRCGAAVKPTSRAQVFHFLLVTVSGTTVTVRPTDSTGAAFDVTQYSFAPDTTAPSAPPGVTATATSGTAVHVQWGAGADDVGITAYDVLRDGARVATVGPTTTSYDDTSVTAGTTYAYTVVARDAAGNSSAPGGPVSVTTPAPADTTPPSVPSGLSATAAGPTEVDLGWSASTDDVGVTGYEVRRDGSLVATVGGGATSYRDTSVAASTSYSYTVVARDAAGNSSAPGGPVSVTTPAPADTTPPSVPSGLSATAAGPTEVDLGWSASTDDVGVTGYEVRRDGSLVATVGGGATSYRDTSVAASTSYSYTVVARDAAGNSSAPGGPVSVTTPAPADTTPPSVPSGLSATAAGPTEVDLGWSASTDDVGVTGYEVRRDGLPVATVPGTTTGYADTGVTAGGTYTYTVVARDAAGNASAPSGAATATTPGTPPLFSDGFESGDLSRWTSNAGLVVQNRVVASGAWAAEQVSTGAATSAQKTITATSSVYFRIRFNVVSRAANSVYFLKLRTAGSTNASILAVYVNANGVLSLRNDAGSQTVYSTVPVTNGTWHTVQVHAVINGSASSTEVWYDGAKVGALSLAQTTLGVTPVGRLQLGDATGGRTYDVAFDDVEAATSFVAG